MVDNEKIEIVCDICDYYEDYGKEKFKGVGRCLMDGSEVLACDFCNMGNLSEKS